ncbi:methyltransferase domain-containing protein [Candidatus Omnitrophota bacterium]
MKTRLLDYLVCPECKSELKLEIREKLGQEVISGSLNCGACRSEYSISGGIPRMLKKSQGKVAARTARNFGYSWSNVWKLSPTDQIEADGYFSGLIQKSDFKDRVVLDAGCGNGRITYFIGRYNAKEVIGFDFSNSVEAAFENTKDLNNVHIVQADIYNLPLKQQYDLVYSIGVLHHLPEPEEGFKQLSRLLTGRGQIFAWVYGREGNKLYLKLFEPLRKLTSRLPLAVNKVIAIILAAMIWLIIKLVYLPVAKMGAVERLPLGRYLLFFHKLGFRQFRATVFDKMIPPISNYYTKEEFGRWFENQDLKDIRILPRTNNSWRGLGGRS